MIAWNIKPGLCLMPELAFPTEATPGTPEKDRVMAMRAACGLPLHVYGHFDAEGDWVEGDAGVDLRDAQAALDTLCGEEDT